MTRAQALWEKYKEYADVNGKIIITPNNEVVDGRGRNFEEEEKAKAKQEEIKKLDELANSAYVVGKVLTTHLNNTVATVKDEVKQAFDEALNPPKTVKKLSKKEQFELDVKNKSVERKLKSALKYRKR